MNAVNTRLVNVQSYKKVDRAAFARMLWNARKRKIRVWRETAYTNEYGHFRVYRAKGRDDAHMMLSLAFGQGLFHWLS
jgi:hypothetical protein